MTATTALLAPEADSPPAAQHAAQVRDAIARVKALRAQLRRIGDADLVERAAVESELRAAIDAVAPPGPAPWQGLGVGDDRWAAYTHARLAQGVAPEEAAADLVRRLGLARTPQGERLAAGLLKLEERLSLRLTFAQYTELRALRGELDKAVPGDADLLRMREEQERYIAELDARECRQAEAGLRAQPGEVEVIHLQEASKLLDQARLRLRWIEQALKQRQLQRDARAAAAKGAE